MVNPARSLTDRDIWQIALPMILSNITVPMLGMVDTGVTGHLDSPVYLGAVAIGTAIFGVIYTGFNFLRMGTTGIAAQRYGAEDYDGLRVALGQALIVATLIAVALILLQQPIAGIAMPLLGVTDALAEPAATYYSIRILSAPATLAGYALIGWFIGIGDARSPLLMVVTINIINIVLDLLLVLVFDMKVAGVAAASVTAEYSGLAFGLLLAVRKLRQHPGQWQLERLANVRAYGAFLTVNVNLFIRTLALMFAITWVTARGARLGPAILAANAVLMQFQNLTAFALDGIAHAAESLVGQAVGSRNRDRLQQAVKLSLKWSLIFATIFCAFYLLAGGPLIRLMTDLDDVRQTAMSYLPWMILSPIVSVWSFLYDGVFVGATRSRDMRNVMLVSTFLIFLPAWYVLQPFGNHGLWAAFLLFLGARGLGMHWLYHRNVLPTVGTLRS